MRLLLTRFTSIKRVKVMAVNILAKIPMDSVTAKPRTAPVPNAIKIAAANNVVILESKIVENAFLNVPNESNAVVIADISQGIRRHYRLGI